MKRILIITSLFLLVASQATAANKTLSGNAEVDSIKMKVQSTDPDAPPADYMQVYLKAAGVYVRDSGGTVTGPFIETGATSPYTTLYDNTLASPGIWDVSSISQDYDELHVVLLCRSTQSATGDTVYSYFNNDTTAANYHNQNNAAENGAAIVSESAHPAISIVPGSTAPANSFGITWIKIPFYTSTAVLKVAFSSFSFLRDAGHITAGNKGMSWEDGGATAINRITLQPDGYATDTFAAGSRLIIIGVNY